MVDVPDNLVLQILRDIRAKQDDHSRQLDGHTKELADIREVATMGVGLATMANFKLDRAIERLDGHESRIERLEGAPARPPI